ncbi:hypothetical protein Q4560_00080 [Celeribacter halophilus]|uniref:hypothetical protein n=1 Tax=Celeribacter halophilus TaxID=576117 RepID=UPI0026E482E0|nr:hypothetical protein [Celeribacter halophilus]MDO6721653.1 hypothetical protein [Celeribacter halophilus]
MIQNTRRAFTPLHKFACELSEALLNATLILGGKSHWRRAKTLLEDLQMQTGITRKMRNDALILHDLLRREQIHDPERAEAAYFSEIQTETEIPSGFLMGTEQPNLLQCKAGSRFRSLV